MTTKIEWTNETWNPITGCTPVSSGCANCYARRMARRLAGRHGYPEAPYHFNVTLRPDRLNDPLRWRKPRMVFVCSMSDLFHKNISDSFICDVWEVILQCPQHTFQILTKRPERMYKLIGKLTDNVWLGVTTENQATADERIPLLLQVPAVVRFVSVEPMLEEINVTGYLNPQGMRKEYRPYIEAENGQLVRGYTVAWERDGIDWIICGAETGPGKRPMQLDWARKLRNQCQTAGVPFFFKKDSNGNRYLDGQLWEEYPTFF